MKKFLKSLLIPLVSFAIAAAVFPAGTSLLDSQTVLADTTADTSIKNGLFHEGTDWNYYVNGEIATGTTTLVKYNGNWWYVRNGKIDFDSHTLCKYNGNWFYVSGGKVNFNAAGLCKYNGNWFYVKNGMVDSGATTLCKYNGNWFYVSGGKVNFSATTLCKYNGNWFYVSNGKVNFNAAGLCRYNGNWFYVSGGRVNFSATGLCRYNGSWWYVRNGVVDFGARTLYRYNGIWWYINGGRIDFGARTLCKYNGTWWFIENGQINWSENAKTLVKYGSSWYYVNGGVVNWRYSGKCVYGDYEYTVENGVVDFGAQITKNDPFAKYMKANPARSGVQGTVNAIADNGTGRKYPVNYTNADISGIIGYYVTDFNNDGSDEMLVVRHSSEDDLIFELYKKDGNSCVKTAQTSVIDGGVRSFNEKTEKIMLCERYGKKYIFMQFHNSDSAFCDGYYRGFALLHVSGSGFIMDANDVFAGSSDWQEDKGYMNSIGRVCSTLDISLKYDNQIYGLAEAANYTDYMSGYKVFAGIETKMSINCDTLRKKQQELTNGAITSFELAKIYIIGEQ